MKKNIVFAALAAVTAVFAEGAMPVTHREATNIVESVIGAEVRVSSTPIPAAKTNLLTYVREKAHPVTGETREEDEDGSVVIGKDASGTISTNFMEGVTAKTQLRSEAIAIGHNATVSNANTKATVQGIAVGWNAKAIGSNAIAIGSGAKHWYETDEGGDRTYANGSEAVAFGYCARVAANRAVQIGKGINTNAETLQFREWPLVGADGKIPSARLPDMDEKYLTTNLVGKTIVTGTNTVLKMGAGTRVNGTDDMYIRLGGGELIFPDNLGITVRGNRTLGTWGITNGYTKAEVDAALAAKVETDPHFTTWTNGVTVAAGKGATVTNHGATAIGPYATAKGSYSVAIGCESWAQGEYAVQLGSGYNRNPGTLQFGEWTLLDEFGKIPKARLSNDVGSIPTSSDEMVRVGPLVLNAEPVLLALGVYSVGDPWDRSTWGLDSGCAYTEGSWTFSDGWDDVVNIGADGIYVYGDNHLTFVNGTQWVAFPDKVKSLVTPAVVLEKIKAMNDTQKAELKAFLGIQ